MTAVLVANQQMAELTPFTADGWQLSFIDNLETSSCRMHGRKALPEGELKFWVQVDDTALTQPNSMAAFLERAKFLLDRHIKTQWPFRKMTIYHIKGMIQYLPAVK